MEGVLPASLLTVVGALLSRAHEAPASDSDGAVGCVCTLGCLGLFVGFIWFVRRMTSGGVNKLMAGGKVARGILLRVDIPLTRWAAEGGRQIWQRRKLRIDVELPGEAPYEIDDWVQFPTNLSGSILPGATVELRVDPKNKKRVLISGPGAALGAAFFNPTSQA